MGAVRTEYCEEQMLANVVDHVAAGDFDGVFQSAKVGLFTNDIEPDAQTVYADLTQPVSTALAEQACAFSDPYRRVGGGIAMAGALLSFQLDPGDDPEAIRGYYITDGKVTPKLLAAERFAVASRVLNDETDHIALVAEIALSGDDQGTVTLID